MCVIIASAVALITAPLVFLVYVKWCQTFWARKRVPYIAPNGVWRNIDSPIKQKQEFIQTIKDAYVEFKSRGVAHGGIYLFTQAVYMPMDLDLVKNILVKDFQNFNSYGFPYGNKKDRLSANLFNLDGDKWKDTREKLAPLFTPTRMKIVFDTLHDCGGPLIRQIDSSIRKSLPIDVKEVFTLFTTDVISSCVLGLDSIGYDNPETKFKNYGRQLTTSFENKLHNSIKFVASLADRITQVRQVTLETEKFFVSLIEDVLNKRKQKGVSRNDFMQFFLDMEPKTEENNENTSAQIASQAYAFLMGNYETTIDTMTFLLHELAHNQGIQDNLREEVKETVRKNGDELTYDGIMGMKYLDQVVNEALRKYPPTTFLSRICTEKYQVPNTNLTLQKGTPIVVSSLGIHRDEEYYPEPEVFDPNRFTEENRRKRPPFTFIPFGEGPRNCIGKHFAVMQIKTGISLLLNSYKFLPGVGLDYKLKFESRSVTLTTTKTVWLNAVKLSTNITRYY